MNILRALHLLIILVLLSSGCAAPTDNPGSVKTEAVTLTPVVMATPVPTMTPTLAAEFQVSEAQLKNLKLTFLHPWAGVTAAAADSLVNEFNQSNKYKIFITTQAPGSQAAVNDVIMSNLNGIQPNLVAAPAVDIRSWREAGLKTVDLANYAASEIWGIDSAAIDPLFWSQDTDGAERIGIPVQRTATVLFYNQTWAQELGFNLAPTSVTEFQTQVCAAAQSLRTDQVATNDGTGGYLINTNADNVLAWLLAYGANPIPTTPEGAYQFSSEKSEKMLLTMRSLFDQSCAWVGKDAQPYDYFANRQALFYTGTLQDAASQATAFERAGKEDQWVMLPFPRDGGGGPVLLSSGPSLALTSTTAAEQLGSWIFARWLLEPAQQDRLASASGTLGLNGGKPDRLIADLPQGLVAAPGWASWRMAGPVLADAYWWSLQPQVPADAAADILKELDATVAELLSK